jgi:hypothetical protein
MLYIDPGTDGVGGSIPIDLGELGGAAATPVAIDLWCPVGDDWESIFGEAPAYNLGGASGAVSCPPLPSLHYSESYCVATFVRLEPLVLSESGTCCYEVASVSCR